MNNGVGSMTQQSYSYASGDLLSTWDGYKFEVAYDGSAHDEAIVLPPGYTGTGTYDFYVVWSGTEPQTTLNTNNFRKLVNSSGGSFQSQISAKQDKILGVSNTEIGYLDGVTSSIQTQLNAKQTIVSGVSDTEIGYLDGVTSSIQTQINTKASTGKAIAMAIVFGG
jgi:hypothetical protein